LGRVPSVVPGERGPIPDDFAVDMDIGGVDIKPIARYSGGTVWDAMEKFHEAVLEDTTENTPVRHF
jgi:hypothetical protein